VVVADGAREEVTGMKIMELVVAVVVGTLWVLLWRVIVLVLVLVEVLVRMRVMLCFLLEVVNVMDMEPVPVLSNMVEVTVVLEVLV
jgi:hypothetical protein